jgi:hypothetical protein
LYSPIAGVAAMGAKLVPIALGAGGTLLAAATLTALDWRGRRISAAFILTGLVLAAGAALMVSSSSRSGFFTWSLVPAAAIATVICALRKGASIGAAAHVCAACAVGATLVAGYTYSDLKWLSAAIFALCPLLALIADAVLTPMLKPKMASVACVLAAAIPAAVAILISLRLPEAS